MKLIVTGGTGFIGSHFLRAAIAANHEVIAIRRPGSTTRITVEGSILWIDAELSEVNFNDFGDLNDTCLIHLAAHGVNPKQADWESCFQYNVHDSLALWLKAIKAGVSQFIICGSCFEYGKSAERYDFIPTDAPLEPTGAYHASKAAATMAALGLATDHKLKLSIVRPFHVYGEGEDENRLWPSIRRAALSGADLPMTNGMQIRDFLDVGDLASIFLNLCSNPPCAGSPIIINAGKGRPLTIKEFAESWWRQWDAKGKILFGALPYRKDEVMRYVPKIEPIHNLTE